MLLLPIASNASSPPAPVDFGERPYGPSKSGGHGPIVRVRVKIREKERERRKERDLKALRLGLTISS